jgi:hypothetical protein
MVKAQCEKCGAVVAFEKSRVEWTKPEGAAAEIGGPREVLMSGFDYLWCPYHGGAQYHLRRPVRAA